MNQFKPIINQVIPRKTKKKRFHFDLLWDFSYLEGLWKLKKDYIHGSLASSGAHFFRFHDFPNVEFSQSSKNNFSGKYNTRGNCETTWNAFRESNKMINSLLIIDWMVNRLFICMVYGLTVRHGQKGPKPAFSWHEAWGMSHEPWTINNRLNNKLIII